MEGHFVLVIMNLRWAMGVVYSLYDALVSINVPDEKAKAVIDALEREMMDKLATKADVAHVREILSKDMEAIKTGLETTQSSLMREISASEGRISSSLEASLAKMETRLTVRLGGLTAGFITLALGLVGAVQFFR